MSLELNRIRKLAGLNESVELTNLKMQAPKYKMWDNSKPVPFTGELVKDGKPLGKADVLVQATVGIDAWHPEDVNIESVNIMINGKPVNPDMVDIPEKEIKLDLLDVMGDPQEWPKPHVGPWRDDL